jgi:hypothetical protein
MNGKQFNTLFARWGVPWERGDYGPGIFKLNDEVVSGDNLIPNTSNHEASSSETTKISPLQELQRRSNAPLLKEFSMKALQVKNIDPTDAIYIPKTPDRLSASGFLAGIAFVQVTGPRGTHLSFNNPFGIGLYLCFSVF